MAHGRGAGRRGGGAGGGTGRREVVTDAFRGSVPQGTASAEPLALSFKETLDRGLQFNLGLLLQEESRTGRSRRALDSAGRSAAERQRLGLGAPPGDQSGGLRLPGAGSHRRSLQRLRRADRPFRSGSIDLAALNTARAASLDEKVAGAGHSLRPRIGRPRHRQPLSRSHQRVEPHRRRARATGDGQRAAAPGQQSQDVGARRGHRRVARRGTGAAPAQRLIVAENEFEKTKLRLGRSIGLPPGQPIRLTDTIPFAPLDAVPLEQALAGRLRPPRRLSGGRRSRSPPPRPAPRPPPPSACRPCRSTPTTAPSARRCPNAHPTYTVAATLRVPIFEGGRVKGRTIEAEAELRQQRAVYDDLRGRIDTEVRSAFLDVNAAAQQVDTAQTTVGLATQELAQARDRFAAGVSDTIEVTRAQESLARASEDHIEALYQHNVAKAALARAVGIAEEAVLAFASGVK